MRFTIIVTTVFAFMLLFVGSAAALDLGADITIFDRFKDDSTNTWYNTYGEDEDVEPGASTGQAWDLEAMYYGKGVFSAVGGFDFINGQDGIQHGDLFLGLDGDEKYGQPAVNTGYGPTSILNNFGWDLVVDLDFNSMTYDVYAIDETATLLSVQYEIFTASNPYRYESGGTLLGSGSIFYATGLTDAETGLLGGSHNLFSIDLSVYLNGKDFLAHLSMGCGNDMMMGNRQVTPIPGAVWLMGTGLVGLVGMKRRRAKRG